MNPENIENFSREQGPGGLRKMLMVDGKFLAGEMPEFNLSSLEEPMLGNDKYSEVYLETRSGNIYLIKQNRLGGSWSIIDARSNAGKGPEGLRGDILSDREIKNSRAKVGEPFRFGRGAHTSALEKITGINKNRIYTEEYLQNMTDGETTDVDKRFRTILEPKKQK